MERPDAGGGEASRPPPLEPEEREQGDDDASPEAGSGEIRAALLLDVEDGVRSASGDGREGEGKLSIWSG